MHDLQYRKGKPTIAALTGPARAAGVTLVVSCDCIVAADTASLAYPIRNITEADDAQEGLPAFNEKRPPRW